MKKVDMYAERQQLQEIQHTTNKFNQELKETKYCLKFHILTFDYLFHKK